MVEGNLFMRVASGRIRLGRLGYKVVFRMAYWTIRWQYCWRFKSAMNCIGRQELFTRCKELELPTTSFPRVVSASIDTSAVEQVEFRAVRQPRLGTYIKRRSR